MTTSKSTTTKPVPSPRDLTKVPMRQLKDEAEDIQTARVIDGAKLIAIDIELRRNPGTSRDAAERARHQPRMRH